MLCLRISFLLFFASQQTQAQDEQVSDDFYCGETWSDAATNCRRRCPSGDHDDCLGFGGRCFQFTGCYVPPEPDEDEASDEGPNNKYCGLGWVDAMVNCDHPCPKESECKYPKKCFAATHCDKPLVELEANIVVTMMGPSTTMDGEDGQIFVQTMYDTLKEELEKENLMTENVDLTEQLLVVGQRELEHRYNGRNLKGWHGRNVMISNVTQRMLPVGSSALDASIVVTGIHRPPPYKDLDIIAESSINRQGEKVVSTLRERGERAGREFFNRVEGIEAVSSADLTNRPTRSPTGKPTPSPTGPPTATPSMAPSSDPSGQPSSAPSRDLDQMIMTGSAEDLQLGGKTTSSYGFIFNIRTHEDSPTIVITSLDVYTESVDTINYEVWSKMGSFKGYEGKTDEWDLVSNGTITGKGIGRYTPIPEDVFMPLTIPGGGGDQGTRAVYITLDQKSLVYKISEGADADEVIQVSTPDVDVWEGESVLSYPFPNAAEFPMFYRFPRQFLGAIHIDRLPCSPFSLYGPVYGDLPCPKVPTGSPTLPMPTKSPVTDDPTLSPTTLPPVPLPGVTIPPQPPTRSPSAEPTSSRTPTYTPTNPEPTSSPIVLTKAYFVSVFRNVPMRDMHEREEEKFKQILLLFLEKFTEDTMVIEGIDIWHQKSVLETATSGINRRNDKEVPQVYSLEVTVIMSVSYSFLPSDLQGSMAAETIDGNQELLLDLLRGQNSFYAYFKEMNKIDSTAIDSITIPPTQSPITQAQALEEDIVTDTLEEAPTGSNFGLFVGVGVAALWCCLTAVSVTYVLKMRGEMEEMHDIRDLLAHEKKANPIMTDDDAGWKKPGSAKEDEEAPLGRWNEDKVTGSRRQSDVQASMSRSEHAAGDGGERRRLSRKISLRDSLTGSGLRSSLTELKGSVNKSMMHVSRGVESVRRDGVIRSSTRRSTRNSSTGERRRSSVRMSMGSTTSNNSVDPRSSTTPRRVRQSIKSGSTTAARRSRKFSTTNSVTSVTEKGSGAQDSDRRKRERRSAAKEKKERAALI